MKNNPPIFNEFPALQLVRTGRWVRLAGKLTTLLLIASVIALVFVPWRQTAPGTGIVLALDPQERAQPVHSQAKGVISFVKPGLREGSYVEEGELVLKLKPFAAEGVQQIDTQVMAIESKLAAEKSNLAVAEQAVELTVSSGKRMAESLNQEYLSSSQKWEQTKNEVVVLQAELDDKRNQLRIAEEVAEKGLVSREELFSKRQAVQSQAAKVRKSESAVEEAYRSLTAKEEEIESKKQEIYIKNRAASQKVLAIISKMRTIEKELIDLRNKRGALDRLEVRAPRSGFIQSWFGQLGSDSVKEGDRLFVIVPDTEKLAVEMKVSGNDMPLIHEDDRVRLQFEGWPAVQFVGWPSVAVGTFGGRVNRVFPTDDGMGNFRVVVVPDTTGPQNNEWPDKRYLRQGVRANGWVLLNQVPLGYEIWRQLNGFPPMVDDKSEKSSIEKASKIKLPKS